LNVLDSGKDFPYIAGQQVSPIMITSKLTSKAQTTVPRPVRAALGINPGDEIAYAIEQGRVILTKVPLRRSRHGHPVEDPFATFREWDSPEDDEAFAGL
jgi:antitoxin PrlF